MKSSDLITPSLVNKDNVLAKCDFFIDVGLWPKRDKLDPVKWLENFEENEIEYAVYLLNSFLYFPRWMVDEMFIGAFQSLSRLIDHQFVDAEKVLEKWQNFIQNLVLTYVTGEEPNPTDSGHEFAYKARAIAGISQDRIMSPADALREVYYRGPRPIVFVDDFVGSGHQFVKTWQRPYQISDSKSASFEKVAQKEGGQFFYCPVICTEIGQNYIHQHCPQVLLNAAHMLSSRYSVFAADSIFWPDHLQATAYDFIREASGRAGFKSNSWKGYSELGLAISFEEGRVPNATLPLFWSEKKTWKPLIHRAR